MRPLEVEILGAFSVALAGLAILLSEWVAYCMKRRRA